MFPDHHARTSGEVVVLRDAGVVDQDVELLDARRRLGDLPGVGDVDPERYDPFVGVLERDSGAGVHARRTVAQRRVDECAADPAVGSCDEDLLPSICICATSESACSCGCQLPPVGLEFAKPEALSRRNRTHGHRC